MGDSEISCDNQDGRQNNNNNNKTILRTSVLPANATPEEIEERLNRVKALISMGLVDPKNEIDYINSIMNNPVEDDSFSARDKLKICAIVTGVIIFISALIGLTLYFLRKPLYKLMIFLINKMN